MDAYACPKGHQSTEPDYCSECGAKMQAKPETAPASSGRIEGSAEKCPDCNAAHEQAGIAFCEICGYNFVTGVHGEIAIPVAAELPSAPLNWEAVVEIDPALREAGSPEAPADVGPFTIGLDKPVNLIGRKSATRAIFPEITLNFDDAVSHRHALLQRTEDGALALRDIGAANGTRLNGQDVQPMVDLALKDGDQITVGHWTRITVKQCQP